jgi:hypothetical protein
MTYLLIQYTVPLEKAIDFILKVKNEGKIKEEITYRSLFITKSNT